MVNVVASSLSKFDSKWTCFKSNVKISLCTAWIHHGRRLFNGCKSATGNLKTGNRLEYFPTFFFYRKLRTQPGELIFNIVSESFEFLFTVEEF